MQPTGILHEGAFPGHRQCKEESIEPSVVESFSNVSAGRENQPLFILGNGGELYFAFLTFLRRPSSPQRDDVPNKTFQLVMQLFQVLFALRQQNWGSGPLP